MKESSATHKNEMQGSLKQYNIIPVVDREILRNLVNQVISDGKVFTLCNGGNQYLRKALRDRGWIEKQEESVHKSKSISKAQQNRVDCNRNYKSNNSFILNRMLRPAEPNFFWQTNVTGFTTFDDRLPDTSLNFFEQIRYDRSSRSILEPIHNLDLGRNEELPIPRSYFLSHHFHRNRFINDFRLNACVCLLKQFLHRLQLSGPNSVISTNGTIPLNIFFFAIKQCADHIVPGSPDQTTDDDVKQVEWDRFLQACYQFFHFRHRFNEHPNMHPIDWKNQAQKALDHVFKECPNFISDGSWNMWVVKASKGDKNGKFQLVKSFQMILPYLTKANRCVTLIQKYVENPLLIHETKFDIKLWFLVTSIHPLDIWLYKDICIRFATCKFELTNSKENIHMTNAITNRPRNWHRELPRNGVWNPQEFDTYLRENGYALKWPEEILPKMKEAIIKVMRIVQQELIPRANSFAFYEANFILDWHCKPWLLEIEPVNVVDNGLIEEYRPHIYEDLIKVVIDYRKNNNAYTGKFELIFQQPIEEICRTQSQSLISLEIQGIPLNISNFVVDKASSKTTVQKYANTEKSVIKLHKKPSKIPKAKVLNQRRRLTPKPTNLPIVGGFSTSNKSYHSIHRINQLRMTKARSEFDTVKDSVSLRSLMSLAATSYDLASEKKLRKPTFRQAIPETIPVGVNIEEISQFLTESNDPRSVTALYSRKTEHMIAA